MKRYRVQLLDQIAGAYRGKAGDILELPANLARRLAMAGMAIVCGDEPGETIDPADVEQTDDV
jgi:hypothetical protein